MLRQEAWADLRNECWSLFTFLALGNPVRRCISYLVVSSLSLSLPKAAGPGSEEPRQHRPPFPDPSLSFSSNSPHPAS